MLQLMLSQVCWRLPNMPLTRVQGGLFGIAGQGNTATSLGTTLIENANTVYSDYY